MQTLKVLSALAVLATVGSTFSISAYPLTAHAQTNGMERRGGRRDTRQDARDTKHECNASNEKSRSGCRQEKHHEKQTGRQTGHPDENVSTSHP
jgi:hypothetical protein